MRGRALRPMNEGASFAVTPVATIPQRPTSYDNLISPISYSFPAWPVWFLPRSPAGLRGFAPSGLAIAHDLTPPRSDAGGKYAPGKGFMGLCGHDAREKGDFEEQIQYSL